MNQTLGQAREALRRRQGSGARYDADGAPAEALGWARCGTAYFARLLNNLTDRELDEPSAMPGWTRRHVIAHIGYQARLLSEAVSWVRTGQKPPFPRELLVLQSDVALGASLPAHALRYLFHHSEVHLNVEWRDLTDADWDACVEDATGRQVPLRETPEFRANALWRSAIGMRAGGRYADVPKPLRDGLKREIAPV